MTRRPSKVYVRKGHYGLWYCYTLTHFEEAVHQAAFPFRAQPAALDHALDAVGLGTPGHISHMASAGNGYDEPLGEWCKCSCGEFIWGWMQTAEGSGIWGEHDDPWDAWSAHLVEVGLESNNDKKEKS